VSPAARRWKRDRLFFTGLAVAAAVVTFAGFAPTYFLAGLYSAAPLSPMLHVHGALFSSWILLLVAQTTLVAVRRTDLHRRLGVAGATLAATMTVVGLLVAMAAARRGATVPGLSPLTFFIIPFGSVIVFPALVGAAIALRRQPEAHKRLMLIATAELLTAAIGRLPGMGAGGPPAFFAATDLLIVTLCTYDFTTRGRVHPATMWGGLFLIGSQVGRLAIGGTGAWFAFAGWLIR
jgi:hypothetical protein